MSESQQVRVDRRRSLDPRLITIRAVVGLAEFQTIESARGDEPMSHFIRRHVLAACGAQENANTTD